MTDKLDAEKLYYVKKKNGDVCIRQSHLFSTLKTEKAVPFVDFDDDNIEEVLAPVPEYKQWDGCLKLLTVFTKDNKALKASLEMRNRKWGKLVKAIRRINELSVERKKNIKELNDRVKLLEAALKYSNTTIKCTLPLIKIACDARIASEIEEMLSKTNKVLR